MTKCRLDIVTQHNTAAAEESAGDWFPMELFAQTMKMRGYIIELSDIKLGQMSGNDFARGENTVLLKKDTFSLSPKKLVPVEEGDFENF
jgi:hypothetical protein